MAVLLPQKSHFGNTFAFYTFLNSQFCRYFLNFDAENKKTTR